MTALRKSKKFNEGTNATKMDMLIAKHREGLISTPQLDMLVDVYGLQKEYDSMRNRPGQTTTVGERKGDRAEWMAQQQEAYADSLAEPYANVDNFCRSSADIFDYDRGPAFHGGGQEPPVPYYPEQKAPPEPKEDPRYAGIDDEWFVKSGDDYVTDAHGDRVWAAKQMFIDRGQTQADIAKGTRIYNPMTGEYWKYGEDEDG